MDERRLPVSETIKFGGSVVAERGS